MSGFVYLIRNGDLYKIGRTDHLERRMKQLRPDEVIQVLQTDRSRDLEYELHRQFNAKRLPQSEYFRLNHEEVDSARIALGSNLAEPGESSERNLEKLPNIEYVAKVRKSAHQALAMVVGTVAVGVLTLLSVGHGFWGDLGAALVGMIATLAFLISSAVLLVYSLLYSWLLIWRWILLKHREAVG